MIANTSPTGQQGGDGPEDIDRLLGTFFRGEVPNPWPPLAAPVTTTPVSKLSSSSLSAGRMVLAASIAALFIGGWFVSGRLPGPAPTGSLDNGAATVPHDLRPGGTQPSHRQR
jgi:hypothetical protein